MLNLKRLGLGMGLALAAATATQADTISILQSQFGVWGSSREQSAVADAGGIDVDISATASGDFLDRRAPTLFFEGFDRSLGTLQSATITYNYMNHGTNRVSQLRRTCTGANVITVGVPTACTALNGAVQSVSGSGSVNYGVDVELIPSTAPLGGERNPIDVGITGAGGVSEGVSGNALVLGSTTAQRTITGPLVENFNNGGTFRVQPLFYVQTETTTRCRGNGLVFDIYSCSGDTWTQFGARYRVDVEYVYATAPPPVAPVPLPAGALMLLGALGGLIELRRRAR